MNDDNKIIIVILMHVGIINNLTDRLNNFLKTIFSNHHSFDLEKDLLY